MATREVHGGVPVLGGGFAGGYAARLPGERGAAVVGRDTFMLTTPLLPKAASSDPEKLG
jgi:NADH dehydrogenase FAD-containing subunit